MKKASRLDIIVADIIVRMSDAEKAKVVNIKEENLRYAVYQILGVKIIKDYSLWETELLKELGVQQPDEASMLIIKTVWKALITSGETFREGKIEETGTLAWDENRQCLEISAEGRSLVISGIDYQFAHEIAEALRVGLYASTMHYSDDAKPITLLEHNRVTLSVWTYPKHPSNR